MIETGLIYRSNALIEDLAENECTIHRASGSCAERWWLLWFRAARDTDGELEDFCVPVNPNGGYMANGPGGKTWGLTKVGGGVWRIGPSINVLATRHAEALTSDEESVWHHTPLITNVPDHERWITSPP